MFFSLSQKLMFQLDPERAHEMAISFFKRSANTPLACAYAQSLRDKPVNVMGIDFKNPVGLAAGLDKNGECVDAFEKMGFGFVEVGTVTPLKQYGNQKPRVFRLVKDQALINRLGFNNFGADDVNARIRSNPSKGLLGINIGPNKDSENRLNDYLIGIKKFHDIADYITINISSPNTENLRSFHDDSKFNELLETLEAEKIKLKSKIPIVVKISPDIPDEQIESISKTLIKYKVRAIIVSNTTASNREKLEDVTKHQKGGLSGKPLEDISNKLIGKFYKLLKGKIEIIGVGGVDSGESAYKKFQAGASYIQLYTGMVFQGPNIVGKIKKELKEIIGRNHTNQL